MKPRLLSVLAFALVTGLSWGQELPVTRVVLFTSGVGYFEHTGSVTGNAVVPLTFTEAQVNDVLKSLILRDPAGTVGVVGYPSQDPLERSLGSFALDLAGPGGLAALLPQLRGASLTLLTPEPVTGKLVGIDERTQKDTAEPWLTLATVDGLRVLPLSSVTQVRLLDPKLDQELGQALALLATSRDSRKKTVTVRFDGTGTRSVSLGYIAEAPVWKTSYRLDLTGGKPYLQAWAIVENTGETDWNQVRLGLVSGRPVSFIQDLYTPLYVQRPVYQPGTEAGPAPRAPEAAMSLAAPMAMTMAKGAEPGLRTSGFQPAASGSQAGELFQFTLQTPVTLPRHQSALIPLAAADVTAQKVSLFNETVDALHPQNAVWITNSTGLRLPAGPVTVYDAGAYAGDALTDSLLEKDKRLWTYATDLAVRADVSSSDGQATTRITIVKGVLNLRKELTWTRTYRFANAGAEAKTLVVEYPVRNERTLVRPAPTEKTADYYRFVVAAPASGTAELAVQESQVVMETQGLAGWRSEQLLSLVSSTGPLTPAAKDALQKLADLKAKADQAAANAGALAQQKTEAEAGQGRIRDNLEAVGRDSAQGQSYLKRLMDSEARIDQLTEQLALARQAQAAAQKDLDDRLRNLTVE